MSSKKKAQSNLLSFFGKKTGSTEAKKPPSRNARASVKAPTKKKVPAKKKPPVKRKVSPSAVSKGKKKAKEEESDEEILESDEEVDDEESSDYDEESVASEESEELMAEDSDEDMESEEEEVDYASKRKAASKRPASNSASKKKKKAKIIETEDSASDDEPQKKRKPAQRQKAKKKIAKAAPKKATKDTDDKKKKSPLKEPYAEGGDLPIISDPQAMFDDMVGNQLDDKYKAKLNAMTEKFRNRPLKVATMCSGTESPLLALDMLSNAIEDFGDGKGGLAVEHVFSCEIEPYKQAYIERNFSPPHLFRDIRELGNEQAYTAYGSLTDVPNTPGCVDMLIAGTSCVDYSNLNNEKKSITQKGESGQTWRGLIQWIQKADPPIVIVENVYNAPWDTMVAKFKEIGYHADFTRLDSKKYYICQTRQRGYMFAIKNTVSPSIVPKWLEVIKSLQRPASASLDDMLFDNNHALVRRGGNRFASGKNSESKTGRTDWAKCEAIHHECRYKEDLGDRRPLTGWSESGVTTAIGFFNSEFMNSQVSRVHDLIDINTLRFSYIFVDTTYKLMIWNLSQNAHRDTIGRLGLCPCVTPTGLHYLTIRIGPLVGEELLKLQGIPHDDLMFTKEADADLKDLAGNAMTTTVVGACMFAALLLGHDAMKESIDDQKFSGTVARSLVPRALVPAPEEIEITRKEGCYKSLPLRLDSLLEGKLDLAGLLSEASMSAKKCHSEGHDEAVTPSNLMECVDCGRTSSRAWALPPRNFEPHNYVAVPESYPRVIPTAFRAKLLKMLPMCLELQGLGLKQLNALTSELDDPKDKAEKLLLDAWKEAFMEATVTMEESTDAVTEAHCAAEFRFSGLTRTHRWTAVYESETHARLELCLEQDEATWFLYAKAPPMRGPLRDALEKPLARMRVGGTSFTDGSWEIFLPLHQHVNLTITGKGKEVPSWRSSMGIKGEYEKETRFEVLNVIVDDESQESLASSINGDYLMLPKCGGACGSMRKRVDSNPSSRGMYLFLEAGRRTIPDEDAYVFSKANHRTAYKEYRDVALSIDPTIVYRPDCSCEPNSQGSTSKTVRSILPGKWVVARDVSFRTSNVSADPLVDAPVSDAGLDISMSKDGWKKCPQVVRCDLPLSSSDSLFLECVKRGIKSHPLNVNLMKAPKILDSLRFVAARLCLPNMFSENWTAIPIEGVEMQHGEELASRKCSPIEPSVLWTAARKNSRQIFLPIVDGKQAAFYEQSVKGRPHPWHVQLKMDSQESMQMHIAVNAASLAHQALGLFPVGSLPRVLAVETLKTSSSTVDWRIVQHIDKSSESSLNGFPTLRLTSNLKDKPAEQPPGFAKRYPLRNEQLRSLAWMLSQEATSTPFMEEEVVEALLPNLNWRAEARVQRPVLVRGGIVADEVGYGKTAISLGLISAATEVNGPPPDAPQAIAETHFKTKATLIVIPGHLMSQWPREIRKFLGNKVKVVELRTMLQFNKCTVKDFLEADIVLVNFTVLSGDKYFTRLARFSGQPAPPTGKILNRHFDAIYEDCLKGAEERVRTLKTSGSASMFEDIESDARRNAESSTDVRLGGKKTVYKTVSEQSSKETKSKKEQKKKPAKAKAAPTEVDPWGLKEPRVKREYKHLRCPPLELMLWDRLIVDECHYLTEIKERAKVHTLVRGLVSTFRWFLSGTPSHEHHNDVSGLAGLLGVHLGIKDELPGAAVTNGSLTKNGELTGLERLSALLDVRSIQWHENRHAVSQRFLNRFVRQNVAEIDEIPYQEYSILVELPPAEKAIYLELEAHLKSLEMNSKKALKSRRTSSSDRVARMQAILEQSESAEEALLKRCAQFNMSMGTNSTALDVCDTIIAFRKEQLKSCEKDLFTLLTSAFGQRREILTFDSDWVGMPSNIKGEVEDRLELFVADVEKKNSVTGGADNEVQMKIQSILEKAREKAHCSDYSDPCYDSEDDADGSEDNLYNKKYKLREHMHKVRTATKELCGRMRSLRYFGWVRTFQVDDTTICCSGSQSEHCVSTSPTEELPPKKVGVLSSCGHTGCLKCLQFGAERGRCIESSCRACIQPSHVVSASALGADRDHADAGNFGEKLMQIVRHTQELVRLGDRVIVFVQFKDLKEKVMEAMEAMNINFAELTGSLNNITKVVDVFQKEVPDKNDAQVLILIMNDEKAAGVNLTGINHVIFVHPLLTDTQKQYDMYMTQAIGRVLRYGQEKKVHVWRFLATDTIDMTIFEQRSGEKAVDTLAKALTGPAEESVTRAPKVVTSSVIRKQQKTAPSPAIKSRTAPARERKRPPSFYYNKRIVKFFGDEKYFGTVISYDHENAFWAIKFDDGDEEDFEENEVKKHMKLYDEQEEESD